MPIILFQRIAAPAPAASGGPIGGAFVNTPDWKKLIARTRRRLRKIDPKHRRRHAEALLLARLPAL